MKRREFITLLGGAAAAWPQVASTQQTAVKSTIGFLGAATPTVASHWFATFVQRLRELGWIEGRNVTIEVRWAEGRDDRAAEIAAEFARLKVDIIATWATAPALAAKSGDIDHPHRLRPGDGPNRQRLSGKLGATGRKRYRPVAPEYRSCWQAARAFARSGA